MLADGHLPETISAWALPAIAKSFKGGVPPEGWQGVILAALPRPQSVVLNLDALYRDPDFVEALEVNQARIEGYGVGAGRYAGSQSEIVIEMESVKPADIYAMGGYSSDRDTLIRMMFGQEPTPELIGWFETNREKAGLELGPVWLEGEPWLRVVKRMAPHIERLKEIKAAQLVRRWSAKGVVAPRIEHAAGETVWRVKGQAKLRGVRRTATHRVGRPEAIPSNDHS
ncbi:MAG: hypothetical protein ACK4X1_16920 [Terricaulis sp.]